VSELFFTLIICRHGAVHHESQTLQIEVQRCAVLFDDVGYRWRPWSVAYWHNQRLAWTWWSFCVLCSHCMASNL